MTREEAITKINRLRNEYNDQYIDYCGTNEAVNMAIEALKAEPVRHGYWTNYKDEHTCSVCHTTVCEDVLGGEWGSQGIYDYCPYCGAKMDEVK